MTTKSIDKISLSRPDKVAERRAELGEAALQTLATLGYARTSLREIAQNSEFSHGVLHYYFADKVDLIVCSVRQYKARCVTRYDEVIVGATNYESLMQGFLDALCATLRNEAHMHRLWYDLRSQSMFEPAFRADVKEIDKSLESMIMRVLHRFAELGGSQPRLPDAALYALFDGLFQHALTQFLSDDPDALSRLRVNAETSIRELIAMSVCDA